MKAKCKKITQAASLLSIFAPFNPAEFSSNPPYGKAKSTFVIAEKLKSARGILFVNLFRKHFNIRILVQDRSRIEFPRDAGLPPVQILNCGSKTAGNLLVVEDLKKGTNKDIGPKDFFGMGSG